MRKLNVYLFALVSVLAQFAPQTAAQQRPAIAAIKTDTAVDPAVKLPVRRVVLYKSGVGYFEHLGHVRGNQDVNINFTSAQLNDVLKSLTVLDLDGGRISGVSYNSDAPLGQRLAALRLPIADQTNVAGFLDALRGARLEVRSGSASVSGRLLSVEKKSRTRGDVSEDVTLISLVSDSGELHTVELLPSTTVRLAERDLTQDVGRYLGLLASSREQDLRRLAIATAGAGERQLYVSYISEVPVWKTTYRIVLPAKPGAKPLLQGWAIVDNTVGEDWDNVELSLVAGAPQSFIQQLSQPYYVRRPQVPLPQNVLLTPQTHQATLVPGYGQLNVQVTDPQGSPISGANVRVLNSANQVVAETSGGANGMYSFEGLPADDYHVEINMPGFQRTILNNLHVQSGMQNSANASLQVGSVTTTVEVNAAGRNVQSLSQLGVAGGGPGGQIGGVVGGTIGGMGSGSGGGSFQAGIGVGVAGNIAPAASAQELGDLFEYRLKDRVTIHQNQSAMVPIIQSEIEAEKVSLWNPSLGSSRPLLALWVNNTSNLTLDAGSFNVIESDAFAGEGLVDTLKPGEKRLLSYAADSGVQVSWRPGAEPQRFTRVQVSRGVLIQTSELRETRTYIVRNEDTSPRVVVIEHPARPDWKFAADAPKPAESSAGFHRFRMTVEPKKTATLVVTETSPLDTSYELTSLNSDQIELFVRQKSLDAQTEAALRKILDQKAKIAGVGLQIASRQQDISSIFEDQQRVRQNLESLKGSAEEKGLRERYVRQLGDQESQLDSLRKEKSMLEIRRTQLQGELERMIQDLALDVTLPPSQRGAL